MITDDERRRDVALGHAIRATGPVISTADVERILSIADRLAAWLEHGSDNNARQHRYRDEPPAPLGPPDGYRRLPTGEHHQYDERARSIDATAVIRPVTP